MLLGAKRYALEVDSKAEIWGYEDLAQASFGVIGKVSCDHVHVHV